MKPQKGTYPAYLETYIGKVQEDELMQALQKNLDDTLAAFKAVPGAKEDHAYAPGKWSVKQLLNHITDAERIFAYRALRFARKDAQQPLPFNEDEYAEAAEVKQRSLADIVEEFELVRRSNIKLFAGFSPEALERGGPTSLGPTTVLALGYAICGHANHHLGILKERYL